MAFPKLEARKFASIRELNGICARTMEEHYELYKGYIGKTNEIQEKLTAVDRATANQIYSDLRALRVDLSFATGGVKNHEIYFAHLGGKGGTPSAGRAPSRAPAARPPRSPPARARAPPRTRAPGRRRSRGRIPPRARAAD